jgi:hypothetical protein
MIEIEDINTGQFEIQYHNNNIIMEPKLRVNIIGAILQRDNNYTMTVTMESLGEMSTSKIDFFGKSCFLLVPLFCGCY